MKRATRHISLFLATVLAFAFAGCAPKEPDPPVSSPAPLENSSAAPESPAGSSQPEKGEKVLSLQEAGYRIVIPEQVNEVISKHPDPDFEGITNQEVVYLSANRADSVQTDRFSFADSYTALNPRCEGGGAEDLCPMRMLQAVPKKLWEDPAFELKISGKNYTPAELKGWILVEDEEYVILNVTELAYGTPYPEALEAYFEKHGNAKFCQDWMLEWDAYFEEHLADLIQKE